MKYSLGRLKDEKQTFLESDNMTQTEYINSIANLVTIEVMEILQSENAVLLPQVYERFQTLALQYRGKISETTNDYHLPMSHWLLTCLNNKNRFLYEHCHEAQTIWCHHL